MITPNIVVHTYPRTYRPKPLRDQIERLKLFFPRIAAPDAHVLSSIEGPTATRQLPIHAEAWFAVPILEGTMIRHARAYSIALSKVLDALRVSKGRDIVYDMRYPFDAKHRRHQLRTRQALHDIQSAQNHATIIIIAAQLGIRYAGCSAHYVREVLSVNEFGLDAYTVASILLTHPDRLECFNDLSLICAGEDVSSPIDELDFSGVPLFRGCSEAIEFSMCHRHKRSQFYGVASGFRP